MADDEMMTDALPTGGGGFDWADDVAAEHAASGHDAAVLEAEKEKARKRAERFGQEYKEPKANAIARGLMSRKEVLAMRKEAALKKMNRRGEFVAGIDVFDPAEQAKRAARAAKFGTAAPSALTPEQQAIKDKRDAQDAQRLAANAAALQEAYADAMDDGTTRGAADGAVGSNASAEVVQDFFERRVDPELDASWRADAVHLYGVDHMTTAECVGYFSEYGPVFCEWINDSSCNVVFNDETTARRAIRMKGVAMGAEANPDGGLALPAGTCAEMLWHAGPEFHKDNRAIQLSFRLATEEDIKPDGKIKSRYLWLAGKGGGRGKRRRGGGGGGDRHHPYDSGGKRRARGGRGRDRGGMRGYDDDDDGGVADLRERIRRKKAEKEDAAMGGDDVDVAGTSTAADASVDAAREGGAGAGGDAGAGVHLQGAVGMMKGALMGAVAGRAAEPPRPEIVSSAGDGVAAAAGEVGGDDLRAKLAANAGEDVAMQ